MSNEAIRRQIMAVIARFGDPSLDDICKAVEAEEEMLHQEVMAMVREGLVRQKDDDIGHDWVYRATVKGRESYPQENAA